VTSPATFDNDRVEKLAVYASIGVLEYYLFDPLDQTWETPLLAYRLGAAGVYEPVPLGPDGGVDSPMLGVRIVPDGSRLRLIDLADGTPLLTSREKTVELERLAQRAEEERRRAEQQQQRAEEERRRAEDQRQRAEEERRRAEDQRQRAE